ncbi:hypothetical protein Cni_G09451 [Canna indica]|uniref:HAT C-terminal dimerisation domain-containing protein n=1 Tax=Canna indica TaxID=4628 RepID=A0AAQ3K2I9_9LILI|nr:hypothetical protein Cni_G09451 [Canna indica]
MLISIMKNFKKRKDLIRPGVTRFATAYLTLNCPNDNKTVLMSMFSSEDWKSSKFASTPEGKKIQNMALDSRLWKNIIIYLKAAAPLITVLRLVDSDEKPAMGFIYEGMSSAKEKIKSNFTNVKKIYEPILKILDERWAGQLHRPLHAVAYYLNPHFHYDLNFKADDADIKQGLYNYMGRLVLDQTQRNKISMQLPNFHYARGLFDIDTTKSSRKTMLRAEWWDFYRDGCPELKKSAIRVLSLTCSSSGCECNWSAFEMVHTKKRNRLHHKKMNDLVYVMYNLKLKRNEDVYEADDESDQQPPMNDPSTGLSNETNVDGVDNGEYNVICDAILEHVESMIPDAIVEDVENVIPDVIIDEDEASCDEEEEHDDDDNDGDDIEDVGGFEF